MRPFTKYVNYNHIMPTRYNACALPCWSTAAPVSTVALLTQVPAEISPSTICTDAQMDTPDGRKEARKFAKSRQAALVNNARNMRDPASKLRVYVQGFACNMDQACSRRSSRHHRKTSRDAPPRLESSMR